MSYKSYSSLDSLAANGIVNFDANAYLNGTPPRYVGRPYTPNYGAFDQPLLNYDPFMMGGYGYGYGVPTMGYQEPWASVTPSMHSQPGHDEFMAEKQHDKNKTKSWITTLAVAGLGSWGLIKFLSWNSARKTDKAIKAKSKPPKLTKEERKAAELAFDEAEKARGTSKTARFFKKIWRRIEHAPKWVKITGIAAVGLAGLVSLFSSAAPRLPQRQGHAQIPQPVAHQSH